MRHREPSSNRQNTFVAVTYRKPASSPSSRMWSTGWSRVEALVLSLTIGGKTVRTLSLRWNTMGSVLRSCTQVSVRRWPVPSWRRSWRWVAARSWFAAEREPFALI